ncbi:hypothetical protein ElyMa_005906400 [Elysia marginata]|uniref:Uncharacterized protein n=1 Tax=Elysia marginata TaxID=1093978 RepID=A0AAV4G6W3_9GAST|nr:hypothetical protein ElyMa_005906400 [Elysia marginata]
MKRGRESERIPADKAHACCCLCSLPLPSFLPSLASRLHLIEVLPCHNPTPPAPTLPARRRERYRAESQASETRERGSESCVRFPILDTVLYSPAGLATVWTG